MAAFEYRQAEEIRDAFALYGVRYLFIGKSGAVLLGFPDTTKDGPFDLDLIFAPDGIEAFNDAWQRHVEVEGFFVCHPDDIIRSKAATNRRKDQETLPRLQAFRDYWVSERRKQP